MKATSEIYPIYFLYGPENYLIEEEIQKLMDLILSQKERGLNLHRFSGEEHSGQEIVQTVQTFPMFARYRLVLISEADRMDEDKIEVLMQYIRKPSPTTCLILHSQTIGPWKAYQKDLEKAGKVLEYSRLKGKGLVSWGKKRMLERGKTLSEDAADYLVEVVGDHLHDIENVLEKVFLSVGEKMNIQLSDVEGIASEVKVSTIFDLTDAIGHQDLEKALKILEKALESKTVSFKKEEEVSRKMDDPVPLLLSMMAKQYWNILMVKEMASHHQEVGEVGKPLRISPWYIKILMGQERNFSESSLRKGILNCYRTDLAIKRGRGPKNLLMEKLVIDLCRPT
jgi:DNA polymerase-3 subunit delta